MIYKCPRCGYVTTNTTNKKSPTTNQKVCKPWVADVSLDVYRQEMLTKKDNNTYECLSCGKMYKSNRTLQDHAKKCRKDDIHTLATLLSQMMKTGTSNIINNFKNSVQNIQNNIQINITTSDPVNINSFLHENLSYISDEYIMKCAKRLDNGLVDLIKTIRFNPEHPENMNVKMHVKRDKTLYVWNGKWEICDAKWTLEEMILHGARIIHQKFLTNSDQDKLLDDGSFESQVQTWLLSLLPRNNDKLMGKLSKRLYALILSNQDNQDVVLLVEKSGETSSIDMQSNVDDINTIQSNQCTIHAV